MHFWNNADEHPIIYTEKTDSYQGDEAQTDRDGEQQEQTDEEKKGRKLSGGHSAQ